MIDKTFATGHCHAIHLPTGFVIGRSSNSNKKAERAKLQYRLSRYTIKVDLN
jgi:hypothetical protein